MNESGFTKEGQKADEEKTLGFSISNTGASKNAATGKQYPAAVRVRRWGKLIASVEISTYSPLKYLRKHPNSDYVEQLASQLERAGYGRDVLTQLLEG